MGSVQDFVKCERCGGVTFNDYYYKTGEEYEHCDRCEKGYILRIKRNPDGTRIISEDNVAEYENIINEGYGAIRLETSNGTAEKSLMGRCVGGA